MISFRTCRCFGLIVALFSSAAMALPPQWFTQPPQDTPLYFHISAQGLSQEKAQKNALTQLSQRLLTSVESEIKIQNAQVNGEHISDFKEKVTMKGFKAQFPSPEVISSSYDSETMTIYELFRFDKTKVQRALLNQYNELHQSLLQVTKHSEHNPIQCSLDEKQKSQQLQTFKQLSKVIQVNWPLQNITSTASILEKLAACFDSRQIKFDGTPSYPAMNVYFQQLLADWNVTSRAQAPAEFRVKIKQKNFTRFGQKGVRLSAVVQLLEHDDILVSKTLYASGYHGKSKTKALASAQKKLQQQFDTNIKTILRKKQ